MRTTLKYTHISRPTINNDPAVVLFLNITIPRKTRMLFLALWGIFNFYWGLFCEKDIFYSR